MNHTYQNKILCVIQARGGSKGVPKKNIRKVNGLPLLVWTIISAKKSGVFDSIWVSSDSDARLRKFVEKTVNPLLEPQLSFEAGEKEAGYTIYKGKDGRYYSKKN